MIYSSSGSIYVLFPKIKNENTLTLKDKREICVLKQSKPTPTNKDLAIRFKFRENITTQMLKTNLAITGSQYSRKI
nr:13436_t:CDS:2 [Entrophospora candida]